MTARQCLFALVLLIPSALVAGTEPRQDAAAYPGHAQLGSVTVGAELFGHYVPFGETACDAPDYIAIEVAWFSDGKRQIALNDGQFRLVLNRKILQPVSAGAVLQV